jgi:hypothetical protein
MVLELTLDRHERVCRRGDEVDLNLRWGDRLSLPPPKSQNQHRSRRSRDGNNTEAAIHVCHHRGHKQQQRAAMRHRRARKKLKRKDAVEFSRTGSRGAHLEAGHGTPLLLLEDRLKTRSAPHSQPGELRHCELARDRGASRRRVLLRTTRSPRKCAEVQLRQCGTVQEEAASDIGDATQPAHVQYRYSSVR